MAVTENMIKMYPILKTFEIERYEIMREGMAISGDSPQVGGINPPARFP